MKFFIIKTFAPRIKCSACAPFLACVICAVCSICAAIAFFPLGGCAAKTAQSSPKSPFCVVLDAGHGGVDGGVSGARYGAIESEINLAITKKLECAFKNAGFTVVLTRNDSGGLYGFLGRGYKKRDMQKRAEIIKKAQPDLFISIHQNFFSDSSRRGAQAFFYDEKGKKLAEILQSELNAMPKSTREFKALFGDYFVLKQADCPSCLIECGFLSNEYDEKLLLSEQYQEELAQTIFFGCLSFLTQNGFSQNGFST